MKTTPTLKSIPSDLELLTTVAIGDVSRIASTSSREDIRSAIHWCDGNMAGNATRRVLLSEALGKKGGRE